MIVRLCTLIVFLISLNACDKDGRPTRTVELRFKNATGMAIDSVLLHVGRESINSRLGKMEIDEITEYSEYENVYFEMLPVVYSDTLVIPNSGAFDLVCCLPEGKYRIDIVLEPDGEGGQKAYTSGILED